MPTVSYHTVNGRVAATSHAGSPTRWGAELLPDALGSTVRTTNNATNDGRVARYAPYGNALSVSGGLDLPRNGWVGGPGYRRTDLKHAEQYVRARHYSTTNGRWTVVDPLWPRQMAYAYVGGKPTGDIDPTGMQGVLQRLSDHFDSEMCGDLESAYIAGGLFYIKHEPWRSLLKGWFYETIRDPFVSRGVNAYTRYIANNAGFQVMLACFVEYNSPSTTTKHKLQINNWLKAKSGAFVSQTGFAWRYKEFVSSVPGDVDAYDSSSRFLGSYDADVAKVIGRARWKGKRPHSRYRVTIKNTTGMTSASRFPLHPTYSFIKDYPQGKSARNPCGYGGTLHETFEFDVDIDPCVRCSNDIRFQVDVLGGQTFLLRERTYPYMKD